MNLLKVSCSHGEELSKIPGDITAQKLSEMMRIPRDAGKSASMPTTRYSASKRTLMAGIQDALRT